MSKNNQILLDQIIKQKMADLDEDVQLSYFFEFYSALQILKEFELSYDEINAGIAGASHDGGADSIYLLVNGDLVKEDEDISGKYKKNVDVEFILIQSKYENSFSEDPLLRLSRLCRGLFELDFDRADYEGRYNDHVLSAFDLFRKTYFSLITKTPKLKVSIFYTSKGIEVHPNVQKQADDLVQDIKQKLPGSVPNVYFLGAEQLVQSDQKRPNNIFHLKISETPLSTPGQVFIVLANLAEYFKFITDKDGNLIKHIFESNVRDHNGKSRVNSEIYSTLLDSGDEDFWWLNNGITVLASEVTVPGGKELVIHNPEIVNGLQTSSEIHRFYITEPSKLSEEKRQILIRIIVPESEETRDHIIRATNSQTPIPESSLRATDQIHRQIEEYLKPRGLYYDRRKNFYKNEGKKPKEIISVPFISQCLMSTLMQKPDSARARPSTLLNNKTSYAKLFHKNNALNTYYVVSFWGRNIEERMNKLKKFSATEVTDIKFYILYVASCLVSETLYPSNQKLSNLSVEALTDAIFEYSVNTTYDVYQQLGGTDKVAKGSKLIEVPLHRV
jgi:AIPR protein